MADYYDVVCSMCGDVGFSEKIFHCSNGCNRFQHSYCSNYYSESAEPNEVCDWCKMEEKSSPNRKQVGCSRKKYAAEPPSSGGGRISEKRKTYNPGGGRIMCSSSGKRKTNNPKVVSRRRYKLLKDVMC